jgi:hypothetical protein
VLRVLVLPEYCDRCKQYQRILKGQKLLDQTTLIARNSDIQELLKILQFRYGRRVGFRPVLRYGERFYPVDGRLCSEREILGWAKDGKF